ncbi:Fimbrin-2 [Nymphaea thermarum]|nr:Fimbrin-2 [Nymphaea thermarum]
MVVPVNYEKRFELQISEVWGIKNIGWLFKKQQMSDMASRGGDGLPSAKKITQRQIVCAEWKLSPPIDAAGLSGGQPPATLHGAIPGGIRGRRRPSPNLMRYNILQLLKNLRFHSQGKDMTDADILNWANNKLNNVGTKLLNGKFQEDESAEDGGCLSPACRSGLSGKKMKGRPFVLFLSPSLCREGKMWWISAEAADRWAPENSILVFLLRDLPRQWQKTEIFHETWQIFLAK